MQRKHLRRRYSDYLRGRVRFADYYSAVAEVAGVKFSEALLAQVRRALEAKDEYLNSIPLEWWEKIATERRTGELLFRALRDSGGNVSLESKVCALKEGAKETVRCMKARSEQYEHALGRTLDYLRK